MTRHGLFAHSALAFSMLAAAGPLAAQETATPDTPTSDEDLQTADTSEEVIVTAQRRTQVLADVPQSISVVSGDTLERQQATSFVDYAPLVPGLSLQQNTPGDTRVVLRGINTGGASPTVAIYVDDTPFGSSTGQSNGAGLAGDFDPFDIARVEVLRGPQGTLYGASSLGGVLKFITTAPVLGEFEGRGQAGVETVKGGDIGYLANGVLNVPLGDTLAVRASGYYRRLGGFIETIGIDREDANRVTSYGGRGSVLFEPVDALSIRLTAIVQNIRADSRNSYDADPLTLDLEPLSTDPITGQPTDGRETRTQYFPDKNEIDYRLYNGTLNYDFGFANVTSVTSYGELQQNEFLDASFQLAGLGDALFADAGPTPGPRGITFAGEVVQKKFTQELRLASADSDVFEWLVGGYFTRERGRLFQQYIPFAQDSGQLVDRTLTLPTGPGGTNVTYPDFLVARLNSVYKEYAGFGSVTYHFSPRFDITAGARYSRNEQSTFQSLDGSLLVLSGAPVAPEIQRGRSAENVFTWSVAPRFEFNDQLSIYARVAKGYRPGGPNVVPPGADDSFPRSFDSDTLVSYEGGLRAETANRVFALDASVYYLDWKDIQVTVTTETAIGPVSGDGNGETARSIGAELTGTFRPLRGLSIIGNLAYNDAELTADLPEGNGGFDGDRLPYAPQWTANLSADYEWRAFGDGIAFVGGSVRVIDDQETDFDLAFRTAFGRRLVIDNYESVDLRAGFELGAVTATFFAKNLFNSRGLTDAGGFGTRPGTAVAVSPIRPRTLGVTAGFTF